MASESRNRRSCQWAGARARLRARRCVGPSPRSPAPPGRWRRGRTPSGGCGSCSLLSLTSVLYRADGAPPRSWGAAPVVCLTSPPAASPRAQQTGPARRAGPTALLEDLGNDPRAYGATPFADREPKALVHGDRLDELDRHLDVVSGHHHLRALGEVRHPGHVGGPEVELRPVSGEERSVAAALLLLEAVHLGLELRVRGDRAWLAEYLSALDVLPLRPAKEATHVVARLPLIEDLAEHLDSGDHGLRRRLDAHDLDLVAGVDDPLLDPARGDRAAAGDREDVLDRHQERLVEVALGLGDVGVERLGELEDRLLGLLVALQRLQRRALDHRGVVARELVLLQQVADLLLDQLEDL